MFYGNQHQYLKYHRWSLNDKKAEVRIQALYILKEIYSAQHAQRLASFIQRFKSRMLHIACSDVHKAATSAGLQLGEQLASASIVSDDDVDEIFVLLNDPKASIRNSAALVMQSIVIDGVLMAEIKIQKK
jgi:cohesin complex subunit SA-1/2